MPSLDQRLTRLEKSQIESEDQAIWIHVDGTREEVESQIAAAERKWPGRKIMLSGPCPYIGQTVNEMRMEHVLPPMDRPEWDVPRPESDRRTSILSPNYPAQSRNGIRFWNIHDMTKGEAST